MLPYKKKYMESIGAAPCDTILCECCGAVAVDIHHIEPKGMGGRPGADEVENLIGLCRSCHDMAHASSLKASDLRVIAKARIERFSDDYVTGGFF